MSNVTPINITWNWIINGTPEEAWPLVTDTRQINSASGVFEKFSYVYKADDNGIVLKHTQKNEKGNNKTFTELPFEWVRPNFYQVTRYFDGSPMDSLFYRVSLEQISEQRTHLSYTLKIIPRNKLARWILKIYLRYVTHRGLDKSFNKINSVLDESRKNLHFISPREKNISFNREEFEKRHESVSSEFSTKLKESLWHAITTWTDDHLVVIRPYEFAKYYDLTRREVLDYMIDCTDAGILKLEWRPYCPSCHGSANNEYENLQDLNPKEYCPACHITYDALFDRGIEATFEIQPAIRAVSAEVYCTGGPEKTSHIHTQRIMQPGEKIRHVMQLPNGIYSLYKKNFEPLLHIDVNSESENQSESEINVDLVDKTDTEERIQIDKNVILNIFNSTDQKQLIQLHQITDLSNVATAAEVTTLPRFRRYFNKSLIRQGERFGVDQIVIMFSDLRQSTQLYQDLGDVEAIGLIQQHFDILRTGVENNYGSVIKTIGDAVMAVFYKPKDALAAADEIIQQMKAFNQQNSSDLIIKLGLHSGSAFAITYDQKIDYFGTTINFCSRLEKLTGNADLVVTDHFRNLNEVDEYITKTKAKSEPFAEPIKGIYKEPTKLHRIQFSRNHK